jgi:glycosyltransferase involved in cell wall biosynthesis
VIFTGFLRHAELKYLMPCCDVAIFPSRVAEAGPLVLLEAAASGCFPLGTYFAGMAAHIDSIARSLPPADAALMRLSNDASRTVADIIANTQAALALEGVHKQAFRRCVEEHYDWVQAAHKFAVELAALNSN